MFTIYVQVNKLIIIINLFIFVAFSLITKSLSRAKRTIMD